MRIQLTECGFFKLNRDGNFKTFENGEKALYAFIDETHLNKRSHTKNAYADLSQDNGDLLFLGNELLEDNYVQVSQIKDLSLIHISEPTRPY